MKCISKKNLPAEDENALKQEVVILRALDHPNILKCLGFYDEEEMYYLVMEYMEGGELFDRIVKKTFYSEKEARDLVYILLSTIHYCHRHNVVHRDLKPENLLLSSLDDDAHVKLADFGFAIQAEGYSSLKTQCGTPGYVAPEILSTQPYGKAVDMWSIGVITYILLGGYPPFHDDNQKVLFQKIKTAEYEFHPEYWDAVSDEAKDLIRRLLKVNPLERYTAEEGLNHSWVRLCFCFLFSPLDNAMPYLHDMCTDYTGCLGIGAALVGRQLVALQAVPRNTEVQSSRQGCKYSLALPSHSRAICVCAKHDVLCINGSMPCTLVARRYCLDVLLWYRSSPLTV